MCGLDIDQVNTPFFILSVYLWKEKVQYYCILSKIQAASYYFKIEVN